jgi:hypothetical protein
MKYILFICFFCRILLNGQNDSVELSHFINLFQSEISKHPIGKIEAHFTEGYFIAKSESDYFEANQELGLSSIYYRCIGKDDNQCREEIGFYLNQLKALKIERTELAKKLENFEEVVNLLKIRIYPVAQKIKYENKAVIKENNKGMIEVVVFDLPTGIGSVNKSNLAKWKISSEEAYQLARSNTLNNLNTRKFTPILIERNNEIYHLLINKKDLFITSAILDLKKFDIPIGKYGTLVSIPNNAVILSKSIETNINIMNTINDFYELTAQSLADEELKPLSDNVFWFNGNELMHIERKDTNFKLPKEMKKKIE